MSDNILNTIPSILGNVLSVLISVLGGLLGSALSGNSLGTTSLDRGGVDVTLHAVVSSGDGVDMNLGIALAIVTLWLGAVLTLADGLKRFTSLNAELVRKVVHIGVGNVILLAWWLDIPAWVGVAAAIAASGVALLSYRVPILPSVNGIGRKSWGTFFYAVSIGILVAVFWGLNQREYAAIGVLVMTWGDGLAALVGQQFGRHPYKLWDMQKSWEGSGSMLLVSFVVSGVILLAVQGNLWQVWAMAGVIAIVATGLEAFSKFGIDNLTVPLGSALLGYWLSGLWL
jgi:phytol kinase